MEMLGSKTKGAQNGAFRFRVSDVVDVPLRGTMLRLRLVEGTPSMKALAVGSTLVLRNGSGGEQRVRIVAHAAASGFARQDRLDRAREIDVIVTPDGEQPGVLIPAEIGWTAQSAG
jgi:hypothetical protein